MTARLPAQVGLRVSDLPASLGSMPAPPPARFLPQACSPPPPPATHQRIFEPGAVSLLRSSPGGSCRCWGSWMRPDRPSPCGSRQNKPTPPWPRCHAPKTAPERTLDVSTSWESVRGACGGADPGLLGSRRWRPGASRRGGWADAGCAGSRHGTVRRAWRAGRCTSRVLLPPGAGAGAVTGTP